MSGINSNDELRQREAMLAWIREIFRQPSAEKQSGRIFRGFWRLAVFLSAGVAVSGVVLTGIGTYLDISRAIHKQDILRCLKTIPNGKIYREESSPTYIDLQKSGCKSSAIVLVDELIHFDIQGENFPILWLSAGLGLGLVITLAATFLGFFIPFGLGWIISGFFSDR